MIRHLFSERGVHSYANHLALTVHKQDGVFTLRKRYGDKKTIGVSLAMLERGIQRFADRASHGKGLESWTLHDFRRSVSTALHDRFGALPHVVEMILGHAGGHKGGVAGTYNKALYLEERRRALERWGAHLMELVSGKPVKGKIVD